MRRPFKLIAKSLLFMATGVAIFFIAILIGYMGLGLISFMQGMNLKPRSPNVKTKYVFTFDGTKSVSIDDDFSNIERSWGGSPDSITVEDGVRIIRFTKPAILKTTVDSIEPHADRVKYKGHMGIFTDGTQFMVDDKGIVHEVE